MERFGGCIRSESRRASTNAQLSCRKSLLYDAGSFRTRAMRRKDYFRISPRRGLSKVHNAAGPLPLALASIARRLRRSIYLLASNMKGLWIVRREAVMRAARNSLISFATVLLAGTIAAHRWGKPYLNEEVLPSLCSTISSISGRVVEIEELTRVEAAGITGVVPIAHFRSVNIGPGEYENSTLTINGIDVMFNPLLSLLRRALVISMVVHTPTARIIQADNYSWLGYPHDTVPSSRFCFSLPSYEETNTRKQKFMPHSFEEESTLSIITGALANMLVSSVHVSVDKVFVKNGSIFALSHRDTLPRRFQSVQGTIKLGKDYRSVHVEATARAFERDSSQTKCTMIDPLAQRHFRSGVPAPPPSESQKPTADTLEASFGPSPTTSPGGDLYLKIAGYDIGIEGVTGNLNVTIGGRRLSAPLIDRLLEIPLDISDGVVDGEITLRCFDGPTWAFPDVHGKLKCSNGHLHFWDAPDDLTNVNMTMLFEGKRLYLHNASGFYGAAPIEVTGDLDIDPEDGEYRLMLQVPGVEINDLRETLAVRPLPYPVKGHVAGNLQVTGLLDKPIYTGRVSAIGLSPEGRNLGRLLRQREKVGDTEVGSYDKVPFSRASCVFTLDTSSAMLDIHSIEAEPLAGGRITGSGSMWISPEAEEDDRAMHISLVGRDIPAESVLQEYMPQGTVLPPSLKLGATSGEGSLKGSLLAPTLSVHWNASETESSGNLRISKDAIRFQSTSPTVEVSATLATVYPNAELARQATSQEEATAAAQPLIEGCNISLNLQGADMMGLVSKDDITANTAPPPFRLKMHGKGHFNGRLTKMPGQGSGTPFWLDQSPTLGTYEGELSLNGVKLNQLSVAPQLKGRMEISPTSISIHARGRPDESLDIELEKQPKSPTDIALKDKEKIHQYAEIDRSSAATSVSGGDKNRMENHSRLVRSPQAEGYIGLRRGQLRAGGKISSSEMKLDVANLQLDDLELASLRGLLEECHVDLNVDSQSGHGHVSFTKPKFSGLQGESFEGRARWTGDVMRLERAVLQQKRSRYEVSGEYIIPTAGQVPDMLVSGLQENSRTLERQYMLNGGRWRWQVAVPTADVEEMLPAVQLLTRAKRSMPGNYLRAKGQFLEGIRASLGAAADALSVQVEKVAAAAAAAETKRMASQSEAEPEKEGAPARLKRKLSFVGGFGMHETASKSITTAPSLQDLRGSWKGTLLAYGGTGNSAAEFDVQGQEWQWGPYNMENVIAAGSYHSMDGLQLKRLQLDMGTASLKVGGNMLGMNQDAHFALTDFPAQLVKPIMQSIQRANKRLSGSASVQDAKNMTVDLGDVGGKLFVEGSLGGSASSPQCDVEVRLLEGVLNGTRMAMARASAAVTASQRLSFDAHFRPAEGSGNLHLVGSIPLRKLADESPTMQGTFSNILPSQESANLDCSVEIDAAVKDSGMKLLAALVPQVCWVQGSADIALQIRGTLTEPIADGVAHVNKAVLTCNWLPRSLTNLMATIRLQHNKLHLEAFECRSGRRGQLRLQGSLPLVPHPFHSSGSEEHEKGISILARNLELRVRNVYSGIIDGNLQVDGSFSQPEIGGYVNFSRGIAYLSPGGVPPISPSDELATGDTSKARESARAVLSELYGRGKTSSDTAKKSKLSRTGVTFRRTRDSPSDGAQFMDKIRCKALKIKLGPEMRAIYPFVLNFSIAGDLEINGSANPSEIKPSGSIRLDSGEVNLVATQVKLKRDHPNRAVFIPSQGLDPNLDISFVGADLMALIQGRASSWQDHVILTYLGSGAGEETLSPSEAAKIFEGQLAESLLEENGQLAFSSLAASTIENLLPRIETHGQLGKARWRLVSAPSIPGLLSLDPSTDPFRSLANLTLGSEFEVQFGKSLEASVARKLKDSEMATQWTLVYQLSRKLRMRLNSVSSSSTQLLFEYSASPSYRERNNQVFPKASLGL